jgi:hypothetical protein
MPYKKIIVDNLSCSRRFHISFDDSDSRETQVNINCQHCGISIFKAKDHPQATLLRDEIIITKKDLSLIQTNDCNFKDSFSPAPKKN